MTSERFNRLLETLGDEYPKAVTLDGVRMALARETEFWRSYTSEDKKRGFGISRFQDGSASISLSEVEAGWPVWPDTKRLNFCSACSWLSEQDDFPDILRFVMRDADVTLVRSLAVSVACSLPRDEAFERLSAALRDADGDGTANITKALALTKRPEANALLLAHLDRLWAKDDLWNDDPFTNWRAFDVTCCIAHLLELGAAAEDFTEKVQRLAAHPCRGNRESCARYLRRYYSWLPT